MSLLHRTRLAIAVVALGTSGLASAAQADAVVGRVVGSVVGAVLANSIIKARDKKLAANCRLYDRDGMEVYLPCDPKRPLGEVVVQGAARAEVVAAPSPAPVAVAPLTAPVRTAQLDAGAAAYAAANGLPMNARPGECFVSAQAQWARRPCDDVAYAAPVYAAPAPVVHYAPQPVHYAPPPRPLEVDCNCHHEVRDERVYAPRPVASFLSAQGGHVETSYGVGRVVAVYDSYEESSSSSVSYSESYGYGGGYSGGHHGGYAGGGGYVGGGYGYGFTGGVGQPGGFYPYGGVGYGAGGYAGYDVDRARVAGRDPNGFLTWPGKRVR